MEKKADAIVTSGFGSRFPKGLLLGEVVEVTQSPSGVSLSAIVKPDFDISHSEEVLCIK